MGLKNTCLLQRSKERTLMPSLLFQCYSKIFLEEMVLFGPTVLFFSDFTGNCRFLTHFHISTMALWLHGQTAGERDDGTGVGGNRQRARTALVTSNTNGKCLHDFFAEWEYHRKGNVVYDSFMIVYVSL